MEKTVALIKPDAVRGNHIGLIIDAIERAGLRIHAMELIHLSRAQAEGFYAVHKGKFFFEKLVEYMISGPIVALVLEGEGAISRWRALIGPTDPAQAGPETLRGRFGKTVRYNAVHGSDALETARDEMDYLFGGRYLNGLDC